MPFEYRYLYSALVGWTGSRQFLRFLKRASSKKGLRFTADGIFDSGKIVYVETSVMLRPYVVSPLVSMIDFMISKIDLDYQTGILEFFILK